MFVKTRAKSYLKIFLNVLAYVYTASQRNSYLFYILFGIQLSINNFGRPIKVETVIRTTTGFFTTNKVKIRVQQKNSGEDHDGEVRDMGI